VSAPATSPADRFLASLAPPPGLDAVPSYDRGWRVGEGDPLPYLSYLGEDARGWSGDLAELHAGDAAEHAIDTATRRIALAALGAPPPSPVVADLGCSAGRLLADIVRARPDALAVGVDAVAADLPRAHALVPGAPLLHASVTALPFADATLDGALALNLLEHVVEDVAALAEVGRVLRPGARAVLVVPANPGLYDYYDACLRHERRYGRGDLAMKARAAGLRVVERRWVGGLLYPAFWVAKKRNRLTGRRLSEEGARARVERDIARSGGSRAVGAALCAERALSERGARLPAGIREVLVAERR
jgi:SAM-dependent methyltransferase